MVNDQEKLKERILESMMAQREKRFVFFFYLDLGLVSLFNGISTFVGYLMPKLLS